MAAHPAANPRSIWKGAISFGLVHVPVSLHTATQEQEIDFDWLDRRTMDPVGYKRINKRTGKEIDKEDVVKGVEHGKGNYVVLSPRRSPRPIPHHADHRDRGLRRARRSALRLPGEAVLHGADQQGREGLRAAARGAARTPARPAWPRW
jgi:hypothetical protein